MLGRSQHLHLLIDDHAVLKVCSCAGVMGCLVTTGIRMLQKMGWRQGKGIGPAVAPSDAAGAGRKWGREAGVGAENTPIYALAPKMDTHGLGFDPFKVLPAQCAHFPYSSANFQQTRWSPQSDCLNDPACQCVHLERLMLEHFHLTCRKFRASQHACCSQQGGFLVHFQAAQQ